MNRIGLASFTEQQYEQPEQSERILTLYIISLFINNTITNVPLSASGACPCVILAEIMVLLCTLFYTVLDSWSCCNFNWTKYSSNIYKNVIDTDFLYTHMCLLINANRLKMTKSVPADLYLFTTLHKSQTSQREKTTKCQLNSGKTPLSLLCTKHSNNNSGQTYENWKCKLTYYIITNTAIFFACQLEMRKHLFETMCFTLNTRFI